jgi:hypothetical protein
MLLERVRRAPTAVMAMILAIGVAAHGLSASDTIARSRVMAASDMPMSDDMSDKCNGCAGQEKGMVSAACAAFCSAAIAILSPAVALYMMPAEILRPTTGRIAGGRGEPPDPHPPRS